MLPLTEVEASRPSAYLSEVNGEDGVRATAHIIHSGGSCGSVNVAGIH